ncbi:MAG: hypothetical protein WBO07_04165 [Formosimonas sp.]
MFHCKDATMWQIRLQDEQLPLSVRLRLRAHLLVCRRCRALQNQLSVIQQGVHEWRERTDNAQNN